MADAISAVNRRFRAYSGPACVMIWPNGPNGREANPEKDAVCNPRHTNHLPHSLSSIVVSDFWAPKVCNPPAADNRSPQYQAIRTSHNQPGRLPLWRFRKLDQIGQHSQYCFTYCGKPIKANVSNKGWFASVVKAGLEDFRFHNLRHTWASWHRQAGTSCDELKWADNMIAVSRFCHGPQTTRAWPFGQALDCSGGQSRNRTTDTRIFSHCDKRHGLCANAPTKLFGNPYTSIVASASPAGNVWPSL